MIAHCSTLSPRRSSTATYDYYDSTSTTTSTGWDDSETDAVVYVVQSDRIIAPEEPDTDYESLEPPPVPQYRQRSRPKGHSTPRAREHVPEFRFARPPPEVDLSW